LRQHESSRQLLVTPPRFARPVTREPTNEAPLLEDTAAYGVDCLSLTYIRFVLVPLVPMAGYALQRTAQQCG
jgi:hypothetical protein